MEKVITINGLEVNIWREIYYDLLSDFLEGVDFTNVVENNGSEVVIDLQKTFKIN